MYSRADVLNIIDNYKINLTINEYEEVYKTYVRVMREEVNKEKTLEEQLSMITDFAKEISEGGDLNKTSRRYLDSKFFYNFQNIFGEKPTKDLVEVMDEEKIITGKIIGLKFQTDEEGKTEKKEFITEDGRSGRFLVKFQDYSKYQIENFIIEIEGKEVYNYRENLFKNDIQDDDAKNLLIEKIQEEINRREEFAEENEDFYQYQSVSNRIKLAEVKVKEGIYEVHPIEERIGDNGHIFYMDRKTNKFAKKEYIKNAGF